MHKRGPSRSVPAPPRCGSFHSWLELKVSPSELQCSDLLKLHAWEGRLKLCTQGRAAWGGRHLKAALPTVKICNGWLELHVGDLSWGKSGLWRAQRQTPGHEAGLVLARAC